MGVIAKAVVKKNRSVLEPRSQAKLAREAAHQQIL